MSEPESPEPEPQKFLTWFEDEWDTLEQAGEFGISEWHMKIFKALYYGYGQAPRSDFAKRCFGIWYGKYPQQCRAAVDDAFARNWVQVLSEAAILAIKSDLESTGYVPAVPEWVFPGQLDLYEPPGGIEMVDFTLEGADLYLRFLRSWVPREYAWHVVTTRADHAIVTAYGESEAAIEDMLPLLDREFESIERRGDPKPLGRWYEHWWRRFDHGVRIEFVARLTPAGRAAYIDSYDNFELPGT